MSAVEIFSPKDGRTPVVVLIVEDERVSRKALATLLAASGYQAEAVESAEAAMRVLDEGHHPVAAVVDLDLPGMSGAEFIQKLQEISPQVKPVLVTAASSERIEPLLRRRRLAYLRKPIDFSDLLSILGSVEQTQ